jgi:hypothetical protein
MNMKQFDIVPGRHIAVKLSGPDQASSRFLKEAFYLITRRISEHKFEVNKVIIKTNQAKDLFV